MLWEEITRSPLNVRALPARLLAPGRLLAIINRMLTLLRLLDLKILNLVSVVLVEQGHLIELIVPPRFFSIPARQLAESG